MEETRTTPPGAPGIAARWTSSAKSGVGTALTSASRLWFTLSHGIVNEVYYPRVDQACTRDMGLVVIGPDGSFSEEKRHTDHAIRAFEDGVPAYRLTNTASDGTYRIDKRIVADPLRPALLQEIVFTPLGGGKASDYRVYALLAPHLVNGGMGNTAWIGAYKGTRMLFAKGPEGVSLALACSLPWRTATAGYAGFSDGWQQLSEGGVLSADFTRAENGNVALTGEIGFTATETTAVLVLAFGSSAQEAGYNALASLQAGFAAAAGPYVDGWRRWQSGLLPLDRTTPAGLNTYRTSTAVLAAHRSLAFPGPVVASLSIPWGFNKGDDDLGGYHLVWPRDLVETAGAFLAAGAPEDALQILDYLRAIQEADGHWPQNAWLDGSAYWDGIQMDECGFPILLADALQRQGHLQGDALNPFIPMIEKAAGYILRNGPVTGEDRWEEDAGYSPFTLAVEISALLAAADMLDHAGKAVSAEYLRQTADLWNDQIERWTYVGGKEVCANVGVEGYYVRIAPPDIADAASPKNGFVPIKNRPPDDTDRPMAQIISPDALALVRFGLRAADDPRIVNTLRVIDAHLRCELPQGPVWYRYTDDGYGEHADGAPFDGIGQGRPWPLLVGERAHYEIAAGRPEAAARLLATFEACAGPGGLLPEQVWDGADMPERELLRGGPSGSAMPLVWAHSEHIKLLRSLRDNAVFDMPPQGVKRYIEDGTVSPLRSWRFANRIRSIPSGKILRVETLNPAVVRYSTDDWRSHHDIETAGTGFGMFVADLPAAGATPGQALTFTFFWPESGDWENVNFSVAVERDTAA